MKALNPNRERYESVLIKIEIKIMITRPCLSKTACATAAFE
jgi:hypothetical protein